MAVRGGSNDTALPSIASETIGTDQSQVIRLDKGSGTTRVPVVDTDGLPIEGVAGGTPVPVSGTVTMANPTTAPETGLAKTVDAQAIRDRLPAALDADGGAKAHIQNFPATQPVSAASLPLPTDAATQTTLAAVLTALGTPLQTGGTVGLDAPSLTALESITAVGPLTDTQLRAVAVPVSGTFYQATQPVSAASLPLPTGAAAETTLAAQSAKLPATLGRKAMAASLAVVVASDQAALPVDSELPAAAALADAAANPTTPVVGSAEMLFNGTTWDRMRNNNDVTLLASAARTATTPSPQQTNYNHRGVFVGIDVTAAGTGTLSLRVTGFTGAIAYLLLLVPANLISATGRYGVIVYPGTAPSEAATGNLRVIGASSFPLPRRWGARVEHTDASSWTYSVEAALIV